VQAASASPAIRVSLRMLCNLEFFIISSSGESYARRRPDDCKRNIAQSALGASKADWLIKAFSKSSEPWERFVTATLMGLVAPFVVRYASSAAVIVPGGAGRPEDLGDFLGGIQAYGD